MSKPTFCLEYVLIYKLKLLKKLKIDQDTSFLPKSKFDKIFKYFDIEQIKFYHLENVAIFFENI